MWVNLSDASRDKKVKTDFEIEDLVTRRIRM